MSNELSARQEAFVQAYLTCYNGTQAAIQAGYAEGSASVQASRLLANAKVALAVRDRRRQIVNKLDLKAEDVIHDVIRLKNACMALDENGRPQDATNAARCLKLLGDALGAWRDSDRGGDVTYVVKRTVPTGEVIEADNVVRLE